MIRQQLFISDTASTPLTILITMSRLSLFLLPWAVIGIILYLLGVDMLKGLPLQLCQLILLSGIPSLLDFFLPSSYRTLIRAKSSSIS